MGIHEGMPLVRGQFEAWDYGPVHPDLYYEVKQFGADPVQNIFRSIPDISGDQAIKLLDDAVDQLSGNASRLVAITHWSEGAWAKNYVPGERGIAIPNEDILQEYRKRTGDKDRNKEHN